MTSIRDLWDGPPALSWAMHFTLGVVMALVFAWWFPIAFYAIREGEQVFLTDFGGDWTDHVMDVIAPSIAGLLVWVVR